MPGIRSIAHGQRHVFPFLQCFHLILRQVARGIERQDRTFFQAFTLIFQFKHLPVAFTERINRDILISPHHSQRIASRIEGYLVDITNIYNRNIPKCIQSSLFTQESRTECCIFKCSNLLVRSEVTYFLHLGNSFPSHHSKSQKQSTAHSQTAPATFCIHI